MTPDGKTFDPETVTDKQLVQYEQAIDRGLTEADAMRLMLSRPPSTPQRR